MVDGKSAKERFKQKTLRAQQRKKRVQAQKRRAKQRSKKDSEKDSLDEREEQRESVAKKTGAEKLVSAGKSVLAEAAEFIEEANDGDNDREALTREFRDVESEVMDLDEQVTGRSKREKSDDGMKMDFEPDEFDVDIADDL